MRKSTDDSDIKDLMEELAAPEADQKTSTGWLKWFKRIAIATVTVLCLVVAAIFLLLELAKVEPDFYKAILASDQTQQKRHGSEMEKKILDLRNSVMIAEAWSATFTQDQINGWFAYDLQKKFPDLVPPEVTDPRLVIEEQSMTLAFRCSAKPFRGIAIIKADVFMTGVINQVGIRVKSVHSGMIPVPLAAFVDQISAQARKSSIEIEWNTEEDDPVAIVQLPDALIKPEIGGYIELQEVETSKGKVTLRGVTHPPDF